MARARWQRARQRSEGGVTYEEFAAQKRATAPIAGIANPPEIGSRAFQFQGDIVRWALRRGKAAIWADCGMGKTLMAMEWARIVVTHTGGNVLILTPLAVARQFKAEGEKFGIGVTVCKTQADVQPGINVTNYEKLHHFDPKSFAGVVLDESSCLKDYTSATRNALIEAFSQTPFRLACTATPAPNDHMELGNHAEFLGVMTRTEMLSMFFVHDGGSTQDWRLKGHAVRDFWRWTCTWACAIRRPSDLGYDDAAFILPGLETTEHRVAVGHKFAQKQGTLFTVEARGLDEQRQARRSSLDARVALAVEIVKREPKEPWIIWVDLNDESEAMAKALDACEVRGSDDAEDKEAALMDFTNGIERILVTKPSIAGHGMNWQHCARVVFVGLSHSFEAWYQAIRRTYRFGQKREVKCHVITSDAEGAVVANLKRKQLDAETMGTQMVAEMAEFIRADLGGTKRDMTDYKPTKTMRLPAWLGTEGP